MIRLTSIYLLTLTLIYLLQSLYCLIYLDEDQFLTIFSNPTYANEIYRYSVEIEQMKVIHSLTLASIALFVLMLTFRFKVLNEKHYW